MKRYIAFDIGASNGRAFVGEFTGKKLILAEVLRFDNGYIKILEHYHWNILNIFNHVKSGLISAREKFGNDFSGIGVDSWGLDFGLFSKNGELLANPYCYRDPQTEGMMEQVFEIIPKNEIFQVTGLQFMRMNTLYQLAAMKYRNHPILRAADKFLMIPDIINYWLTGRMACEYTNTSNTQLLDASKKEWAFSLIERIGLPTEILPEIIKPGTVFEKMNKTISDEIGISNVSVIGTSTADTAAAVAAAPSDDEGSCYLSSGTWALFGVLENAPVLTEKVMQYNFGNEGGVFETIRLLRNIANFWLIQECRRIWENQGQRYSWEDLINAAASINPFFAFVDPDADDFLLPIHMPKAIQIYCSKTNQQVPQSVAEICRVCFDSLAYKYRYTLDKLEDILGRRPNLLQIIGGGSKNEYLCQLAANACNLLVTSGPEEATITGNIIMQMIAVGDLKSMAEGKLLINRSFPIKRFEPQQSTEWDAHYDDYLTATTLHKIHLAS